MEQQNSSAWKKLVPHMPVVFSMILVLAFGAVVDTLTAGGSVWTFEGRRRLDVQRQRLAAPEIRLDASTGTTFTAWRPTGERDRTVYLVDFVYTRCESVCSALGAIYTQLQSEVAELPARERSRVALLSVSFDPADGVPALASYARRHRADGSIWTVARPATEQGRAQLLHDLRVVAIPDGSGGFVHNGAIHLVDARGRVLALYDYGEWRAALEEAVRLGRESP
jgi:protein SCO1/2